jgi:hypothetical protein
MAAALCRPVINLPRGVAVRPAGPFCWPDAGGLENLGDLQVRTPDGLRDCNAVWCSRAFESIGGVDGAAVSGDCRCNMSSSAACEHFSVPQPEPNAPPPPPLGQPTYVSYTIRMWWLLGPIFLYGIGSCVMISLYASLREKHRVLFTQLKADGQIFVDGEELTVGKSKTGDASVGQRVFGEFFSISKKELAQKLGPDAGVYLAHLKQCGLFYGFHSLTTTPFLMETYRSASGTVMGTGEAAPYDAFFKYTAGNLGPDDEFRKFAVVFFSYFLMASSIIFAYRRWKILERFKFATSAASTHSATTVMISDFPREIVDERLLQRYFAMACPQQVASMKVAPAVHDLAVNVRLQNRAIRAINALRVKNEWLHQQHDPSDSSNENREIRTEHNNLLSDLADLTKESNDLREQHLLSPTGAGVAFITFKSEQWAAKYMYETRINNGYVAGDCRTTADVLCALRRAECESDEN